jgi:hypothetical protein
MKRNLFIKECMVESMFPKVSTNLKVIMTSSMGIAFLRSIPLQGRPI